MPIQLIDSECPNCLEVNWVNNGDISDLTSPDVEAIRCWACGHEFFVSEDILFMYGDEILPGDTLIEEGRRTAAEAAK